MWLLGRQLRAELLRRRHAGRYGAVCNLGVVGAGSGWRLSRAQGPLEGGQATIEGMRLGEEGGDVRFARAKQTGLSWYRHLWGQRRELSGA